MMASIRILLVFAISLVMVGCLPLHYPISYGYPIHHYYGKRSADAEPAADADAKADPWLAYSRYTGYPYTYGHLPYYTHPVVTKKVVTVKAAEGEEKKVVPLTLPYGGLYNYGYGYSGYPVHYYGKRSADAEPAADADAAADPGSPTDTTDTATDSTGPMDTVPTMVDTSEDTDTGPMDILTTDKDIAARFLSYGYLPRYYPNVFREPISKC